ncbi:methyltransferase [Streptomyces gamaensis]|uniref:Methyltransferase n=1 Tax=Streptomyces gamaensis TaxID=1763542 RepID=A0ABW0YZ75_9ACTN
MTTDTPHSSEQPYDAVLHMIVGCWVSQLVRTAATLDLAERLDKEPLGHEELARATGCSPDSTFRFLRTCASFGLVRHTDDGRFAATERLRVLRGDAPDSLKSYALTVTADWQWRALTHATDAVREGTSPIAEVLGSTIFERFREHPEEGALFSAAMADLSRPVIEQAVPHIDASGAGVAVDIGGADGTFVRALLRANPHLRGVLLDLPHSMEGARARAEEQGLAERLQAVPGDFFRHIPGGDLFLLKFILHDWSDEQCVEILRRAREAMNPGARVVVVDMVLGDIRPGDPAALMDFAMLVLLPGGRERSLAEFDALFAAAGLTRARVTPLQAPYAVIEAVRSQESD